MEASLSGHRRIRKTYRYGKKRYTKEWYCKNAKDKRGYMRYSCGPKWVGRHKLWTPAMEHRFAPLNLKDPDEILPDGYHVTQTWVALCKSWNGFLKSKRDCDHEYMKMYAGQIRKLQKNLGLEQSEFEEDFSREEILEIDREMDDDLRMQRYGTTC